MRSSSLCAAQPNLTPLPIALNTPETQRLCALDQLNILDTPPDPAFDNLTRLAVETFKVPIALVSLVARDRQWFKSRQGLCATETPRSVSFCNHVIHANRMLVVENAATDPRFADNPLVTGDPHIRFYAGAPVRSPEGFLIGTLCIIDTRPRTFEAAERRLLTLMASQADQLIRLHGQGHELDQATQDTTTTTARYQAIFKGAAAGIVRINGLGKVLEINDSALQMLGYQAHDLIGKNVNTLMPTQWSHAHDGYLAAYQSTGHAKIIGKGREVQALHRNGQVIPVHLAVSEVHYDTNHPAEKQPAEREFIGILSDLRDIHSARNSEAQERALLQVLHTGLTDYHALVSGNTLWRFLKEALKNLTGSQYALIGEVIEHQGGHALKIHAMTDLAWNEQARQLRENLMNGSALLTNPDTLLGRVFTRGEVILDNAMTHTPHGPTVPQGHPTLHRFLGVPILDRGKVIGMFAIANAQNDYDQALVKWLEPFTSTCALLINLYRQLNEQRQFMQELQQARDLAERSSQAKTEFLSSMSHELRTPLNAILGFAQLLLNGKQPLTERQQRQADQILRSGRHLLNLINEVLDLARIESGNMQVSIEPIQVTDVMREALEILSSIAAQHGITLTPPAEGTCTLRIMADYTRLKQVLINLISNAIKYNRPNGTVTLHCSAGPETLRIHVTDTGNGIPEHKLNDLFQPFNRLGAEAGSIEGTGVGLALTRKLVQLMQGVIGVNSQVGQGSEFWFDLPLAERRERRSAVVETTTTETATQGMETAHRRVLYIEDNPANQRLIQDVFDDLGGVRLQCVHSAEVGMELACSDPPDLILMDIDLPGMNGFDAQQLLSSNPLTRHIPVVGVSAGASPRDITQARMAGFADYLTKPFDITILTERLTALLNTRNM